MAAQAAQTRATFAQLGAYRKKAYGHARIGGMSDLHVTRLVTAESFRRTDPVAFAGRGGP
jgi:hypothetical protein